jgi:hypothetical protein
MFLFDKRIKNQKRVAISLPAFFNAITDRGTIPGRGYLIQAHR